MCFKLLLPCPQIGNNAWEWSYGKHDEQEFTGLNIVWVGTILDGIFWIAIIRVGIFQVGVILGGNFLWWGFSRWELSGGNHPCGNFPGGSFPSTATASFLSTFNNVTQTFHLSNFNNISEKLTYLDCFKSF